MSIINNNLLLAGTDEGYNLTRSLRFRSSASAYLNRTPASAGSRTTWTWSGWVKRGALPSSTTSTLFNAVIDGNNRSRLYFESDNTLNFLDVIAGSVTSRRTSSAVYRDPSAWYHIVCTYDTTNATGSNRIRLYVNGTQVTSFSSSTDPSQNYASGLVNSTNSHEIGRLLTEYYDGYLTEVNFIDGQALTPSSFGETDTITGVWKPKRYAGTYGTNGFYLPFTDNSALTTSSNVGLGKDFSGNGNYWTTNNISITSGVTYDSMTDVPTLTSATAANYCVLNPLNKSSSSTVSNGNLRQTSSGGWYRAYSTIFFAHTAAFYAEATMTSLNSGSNGVRVGVANANSVMTYLGSDANSWSYDNQGGKYTNGTLSSYGSSFVQGDIIGILFNNGSLTFYKNGVSQGVAYSGLTGTFCFAGSPFDTDTVDWNFGQRPFSYSLPSGALALNTYNLPTSTIVKGNTVMDATLYTGTGSAQTIINAAGFKPDFIWQKARNEVASHRLVDSIRGANQVVYSNLTNAETFESGVVNSFNSNGFTGGSGNVVSSGNNAVAWQWQAGQGTSSSNTNGSITSTVSVNASAGFSVVTATSPSSGNAFTLGHGLGVAPAFIISKSRSGSGNWSNYHVSTGAGGYLLFTAAAYTANTDTWNNTAPTSSVISTTTNWWGTSANLVFCCWTPIAGYSAFGSYTGNGSTDGPFLYLGFRPKYLLLKCTTTGGAGYDWYVLDSVRNAYNFVDNYLYPNYSNAEAASGANFSFDFVSNGIKIRGNGNGQNQNGQTYVYACWAENPFKNALAR